VLCQCLSLYLFETRSSLKCQSSALAVLSSWTDTWHVQLLVNVSKSQVPAKRTSSVNQLGRAMCRDGGREFEPGCWSSWPTDLIHLRSSLMRTVFKTVGLWYAESVLESVSLWTKVKSQAPVTIFPPRLESWKRWHNLNTPNHSFYQPLPFFFWISLTILMNLAWCLPHVLSFLCHGHVLPRVIMVPCVCQLTKTDLNLQSIKC
jgi:hypothetical protein